MLRSAMIRETVTRQQTQKEVGHIQPTGLLDDCQKLEDNNMDKWRTPDGQFTAQLEHCRQE